MILVITLLVAWLIKLNIVVKWSKKILIKNLSWLEKIIKNNNASVEVNVKSRDYCYITGKYRGPSDRYCITKHRLNDKIPVLFYNHKNYDSHLIMQELGKFSFKINCIPCEL